MYLFNLQIVVLYIEDYRRTVHGTGLYILFRYAREGSVLAAVPVVASEGISIVSLNLWRACCFCKWLSISPLNFQS